MSDFQDVYRIEIVYESFDQDPLTTVVRSLSHKSLVLMSLHHHLYLLSPRRLKTLNYHSVSRAITFPRLF